MKIRYRKATVTDANLFVHIATTTYRATFEALNNPVDFERHMEQDFHSSKLGELLSRSDYHCWFLENETNVLGYFTLNEKPPVYSIISGEHPIEIERFYLLKEAQGCGYGMQMMAHCLKEAKILGADFVWLGVWEKNTRAQAFYKKWDFVRVGQHDFWVGSDCQNDYLLQKPLN